VHNNCVLSNNLQQEKIISELENINEKMIKKMDCEDMIKRIINDEFANIFDNLNENSVYTNSSSRVGSLKNSLNFQNLYSDAQKNKTKKTTQINIKKESTKKVVSKLSSSNTVLPKQSSNIPQMQKNKDSLNQSSQDSWVNFKEVLEKEIKIFSQKMDELVLLNKTNFDDLKSSFDGKFLNDIKNTFVEVTLDSTNIFTQKFDDFTKCLKIQNV